MNRLEYLKKLEEEIKKTEQNAYQNHQLQNVRKLLAEYQKEDRVVASDEIEKRVKNEKKKPVFKTGFYNLDTLITGVRPEQVIVIAAPPKSGKSTWSLQLISQMQETNPMLIPLEQSAEELVEIMLEKEMEVPLMYVPNKNKAANMEWVRNRITESVVKYDSKTVFIDHLGYIREDEDGQKRYAQIRKIMQQFKQIAKELQVTIFLIVHIRKISPTQIPTTEDLYESAGILQECDMVIMLWREAIQENKEIHYTNKTLVSVQANRRTGQVGNIHMMYQNDRFIEDEFQFDYEVEEQEYDNKKRQLGNIIGD